MRLELDQDACQGHGRCYALAPELFEADERGHCRLLIDLVPDGLESSARDGVDNCPERALTLSD